MDSSEGLLLKGLVKRFGDVVAVAGVDLSLPSGKLTSFLGPSGCGKTTLLRMIAGLEEPTEGRVFLDGEDITDVPPHKRDIGMVFQSLALFPHLSVAGNIGYGLRIRGAPADATNKRIDELLSLVSLQGTQSRRMSQLSGGQRQRVATARALALEPKLFLLDEPLSALDANLREDLQVELRLLQQKLSITTIMVTHDQREAMTMSDVVVVMREGTIEQIGEPLEVYRRPQTAFVARFVGSTNLLTGTVAGASRVRIKDHDFDVAGDGLAQTDRAEVLISVRPEDAQMASGDAGHNSLPGTVVFVRDLGEVLQCYVDCGLDDHVIVAETAKSRVTVAQGDKTSVFFPPESCVVVSP